MDSYEVKLRTAQANSARMLICQLSTDACQDNLRMLAFQIERLFGKASLGPDLIKKLEQRCQLR